jgi:iron-sulfur cluster repair protein YtfE (RIC family)
MQTTATGGRQMIRSFVDHEHEELIGGIDRIHAVACELPTLSTPQMSARVEGVLRWVDQTLRPHMAWEETWLFPTIDDRVQTRWATRLVRFDHRQITQQAERLRAHRPRLEHGPSTEAIVEVRCDLFGLEALLRADLEREEAFLLPLLEREAEAWTPEWRD